VGARPIGMGMSLRVPGLYERIRTRELKLAFASDPRLHFVKDDPVAYAAALATAPEYSPTVRYQVEELLERKPVRLPRWLLGGRVTCPEARDWPPYEDQRQPRTNTLHHPAKLLRRQDDDDDEW
jgi:hypothetical protein